MNDSMKFTDGSAVPDAADRRAKRRERLQSLRGQRAGGPARDVPLARAGQGRSGEDRPRQRGEAAPAGAAAQRRAFNRAYRILTETPADASGLVAGTPFTRTGVARLLETLRSRAGSEGAVGARVAARVLEFLGPAEAPGENVHDVSVERLQRIARLAQNFGLGGRA